MSLCSLSLIAVCACVWEHLRSRRLKQELSEVRRALDAQVAERAAERTGRVRAEKRLRERLAEDAACAGPGQGAYPLQPIGHLQSCFSQRNGTPRQPLLVPAARAQLVLRPDVPEGCLEGLAQYSHCWLLFVFHANTDLHRLWSAPRARAGLRAKVAVPRLNGRRVGVLATRSPHRPCPIGLSVARVVRVEGRTLVVAGADVVDGSPVLDVKPYLPFCDSLPGATAPAWVSDESEDDPVAVAEVVIAEPARQQLMQCWLGQGQGVALRQKLFPDSEAWLALVEQTLSRDIRSVHQRLHQPQRPAVGAMQHASETKSAEEVVCDSSYNTQDTGQYKVVLQGVTITYDVGAAGCVRVKAASMLRDECVHELHAVSSGTADDGSGALH